MNTRYIQWREAGKEKFSTVIAGDFCPREENCADVTARAVEITAQIKPFFDDADLKILQWECTVTRQDTPIDKSGPNHRCYPECTAFATALGIDTVLLANNHTGDYGAPGVKDTLDKFRALGIRTVGAGMNEDEAVEPLRVECGGFKCSIINAAEYEFGIASGGRPGSAAIDICRIALQIKGEKQKGNTVIVTLHGGHEHLPYPTPRMRSMFRFFAECGADAVFNCHTHCPLGYEVYNGVPVIYSPGNFYFPPRPTSLPCWYIGYVPKFHFDANGAYAMELLPYFNLKQALTLLDEAETETFFAYLDGLCAPVADEKELQKIFDAWCAQDGFAGYAGGLFGVPKPESADRRESVQKLLGLRNLLTCQAHHDLLRNTMLLLEQYRFAADMEKVALIKAAQTPEWVRR